jgi:hypothetical protein
MFFFRLPVKKERQLIQTASVIHAIDDRINKIKQANYDDAGIGALKITSLTSLKNSVSQHATATLSLSAFSNTINTWKNAEVSLVGENHYTNAALAKIHRRQSQGYGIFSSIYNAVSGLFATDTERMIKRMLAKTQKPSIQNKIDPSYIHIFGKLY